MARYFLKRLGYIVVVLWLVSVLVFLSTNVLPGNVAKMILGQYATPESLAAIEAKLGLNDPLPVQYLRWFVPLLRGDLGDSLIMERPIAPLLVQRLGRSLSLALASMLAVTLLGLAAGVWSAARKDSGVDLSISTFSFLGISIPEFFWGILLIVVFSSTLGLLPPSGYVAFSESPGKWLAHLTLPTMTLTFTLIAHVARLTRSSMIEVLRSNYIRAARARGLPRRTVFWRHALKNALMPAVTVLALDFGWLMGGIVVVETVFAYPGFGTLTLYAIQQRDLPLIQACLLVSAVTYGVANLVADLIYTYIDPRVRYGEARA